MRRSVGERGKKCTQKATLVKNSNFAQNYWLKGSPKSGTYIYSFFITMQVTVFYIKVAVT